MRPFFTLLSSLLLCCSTSASREIFAFCAPCTADLFAGKWDVVTTIGVFGQTPEELVTVAHQHDVKVVLGVSYGGDLANATARAAWINEQLQVLKASKLDGLNLDNEGNSAAGRDALTTLVAELREATMIASADYTLSFDLGVLPNNQAAGYDHKSLGKSLDFVLPMAYDECWGTRIGAANSDIRTAQAGIEQYSALGVSAANLVIGYPWYGWDFPCTGGAVGDACAVDTPAGRDWFGYATQVGYDDVLNLAKGAEAPPKLENNSMTMVFDYIHAETKQRHQVWFDDASTLSVKYLAAVKSGVRGIAMWTSNFAVAKGDSAMWDTLREIARM